MILTSKKTFRISIANISDIMETVATYTDYKSNPTDKFLEEIVMYR
jgi:hypothetical protein